MNRRQIACLGLAAAIAALAPVAIPVTSRQPAPGFLDHLAVDPDLVRDCHVRAFQLPASSSLHDQLTSLYWVVALGFVASSADDVPAVRDAAWSAVPEWYIASGTGMNLGPSFEAGLGGQSIGDGAAARYWDVDNPGDQDNAWRQFAIGCVSAWSDERLLMLWGCAAEQNPVAPLLDLATSARPDWDASAASLVPSIARLPLGMVVIDDGQLDLRPTPQHPVRVARR